MSEFSSSFHLAATNVESGVDLLRRAGVSGWTFPPENGWVTVVPVGDMEDADALIEANEGWLLHYMNAEDHFWGFLMYDQTSLRSEYGCEWFTDEGPRNVDPQTLAIDLSVATGRRVETSLLADLLSTTEPETDETGANVGHRFAETIGLTNYVWLSGDYLSRHAEDWPSAQFVERR